MNAPEIFLSAASADLQEWRNLLHKAFERAGCKVHTQKQSLSAATGDVLDLLRHHLDKSDYIIHLAGLAYGAEPDGPAFAGHPQFRCSYTQFEYYYAHAKGKKVISFVCAADFPYRKFTEFDATDAADYERRRLLQAAHRERLSTGQFTGTPLEGRRPLSEPIADVNGLFTALGAAIGTIRDHATTLAAVQHELAAGAGLHRLPLLPPGFVGRSADLAALRSRRTSGTAHVAGLKGMGGIGKTALAIVLAHEWSVDFPDAQLMLDGRGTHADPPSGADLIAQVIHAFHPSAKLPEGEKELREIYVSTLQGKRVLLLLDNAHDARQVKPLLPPVGCALLVTSRNPFMLGTVPPHRLGELPEAEAVELLRTLCPALTEAQASAVAQRCARLPLALRLAGSHLAQDASDRGVPDVAGYLAKLNSERLQALDNDAADAAEATISETMRLSEAALPADLRATWRKLGVFPASFDARAALAVAGANEDVLQQLLRRSLIEAEGLRYRLHDLAAEYSCARLTSQSVNALRIELGKHYGQVLLESRRLYESGSGVIESLSLFDSERTQIEAALAWLLAVPEEDLFRHQRDELIVSSIDAGIVCFRLRMHPQERIPWLEAALAAAVRLKQRRTQGNLLGNIAQAWSDIGDAHKAIAYSEQALVVAREIGDTSMERLALQTVGNACEDIGQARKAVDYYERALVIARALCDRRGIGNLNGDLGSAWSHLGETRKAIEHREQALLVSRELNDAHALGRDLNNLGRSWLDSGDERRAIGYHEQALVIARKIGDRFGQLAALANLGVAWEKLGDVQKALAHHDPSLIIAREIGDRRSEGTILGNIGNAYAILGKLRKAIACFEQQLLITADIKDPHGEARALINSADTLAKLGERAEAQRRAERAAEIFTAITSPHAQNARQLADRLREGK